MRLICLRRQHRGTCMLQRVDHECHGDTAATGRRRYSLNGSDHDGAERAAFRSEDNYRSKYFDGCSQVAPERNEFVRAGERSSGWLVIYIAQRRQGVVQGRAKGANIIPPYSRIIVRCDVLDRDMLVGGGGPVVLEPRSWDLGFATASPSRSITKSVRPACTFRASRIYCTESSNNPTCIRDQRRGS